MEIWILFFKKKEHVYNRNDALQDLKNVGREGSPWVETEGRQDDRSPQKLHDSPALARLLSRPLHMFELREDIVGTSLVVQGRRHHIPNTGSRGSIPDGGTKIPYASRCGRKNKKTLPGKKTVLQNCRPGGDLRSPPIPWSNRVGKKGRHLHSCPPLTSGSCPHPQWLPLSPG